MRQIQEDLLKSKVPTIEIIKFYIQLLKFWSLFDSNFRYLQKMIKKIKNYFLSRDNALRCIISLWIEEIRDSEARNQERESEMVNIPIYEERDTLHEEKSQESEVEFHFSKSKQTQNKVKYRRSNIKTLLIDLYGSRESFLAEYEHYLAEKILYFQDFNLEAEKQTLEFLQKHLKNSACLSRCHILINDLDKSRRIVSNFHSRNPSETQFHFLVISKSFWPINYSLDDIHVECFDSLRRSFLKFAEFFKTLYPQQAINFHYALG